MAAPFRVAGGTEIAVTISAGVTVGTGSIEHLVDEADRALYTAKRRGRDQVRLFTDLGPADLVPGDSDAVRLAQALAFAVETREGAQNLHSRHVPTWPAPSPRTSACPTRWSNAAVSPAGCTTSAS